MLKNPITKIPRNQVQSHPRVQIHLTKWPLRTGNPQNQAKHHLDLKESTHERKDHLRKIVNHQETIKLSCYYNQLTQQNGAKIHPTQWKGLNSIGWQESFIEKD